MRKSFLKCYREHRKHANRAYPGILGASDCAKRPTRRAPALTTAPSVIIRNRSAHHRKWTVAEKRISLSQWGTYFKYSREGSSLILDQVCIGLFEEMFYNGLGPKEILSCCACGAPTSVRWPCSLLSQYNITQPMDTKVCQGIRTIKPYITSAYISRSSGMSSSLSLHTFILFKTLLKTVRRL